MSEEMAKKKKADIEMLEKQEQQDQESVKDDWCPVCKLPTGQLKFINMNLVKMFGFVECTRCGAVYVPRSILRQKEAMAKSGLMPNLTTEDAPSNIIIE